MAEQAVQKMDLETMPQQGGAVSKPAADNPMISMIERVAMNPDVDIDKLERLLEMKERLEHTEAQRSFNEALAHAQAAMPNVVAKHNNDQTRSKYAKLADIYEACKPIAAKYGFSFNAVPVAGGREGYMNMKWTLRRGAYIESDVSEVPIDDKGMKGTANKTGTHAYGSTTQYGRRYLFCAVFDIAVGEDNDGNAIASSEPVSDTQRDAILAMAEEIGGNTLERLCAWKKVESVGEISASDFGDVMTNLATRKAKVEAKKAAAS